jgi:phosphoglycolate phosphatase
MKPNYDLILFDIDGTLTDSEPGITGAAREALMRMGFPIPEQETLRKFIGPPLWQSFIDYCGMTAEQAEQAVEFYRATYNVKGAFENKPYPYISELLDELRAAGATLAVATSKPASIALPVLKYFHLMPYFKYVSAPGDDEHSSRKKELILSAESFCGISKERTVMIGDTHFDAAGAREAQTDFIGVLYGFGTKEEMEREGAKVFARNVAELKNLLLRD